MNIIKYTWKVLGPMVLSAFSFFLAFHVIEPLALFLNFDLLHNKGVGKIAFSVMAIYQIILFLSVYSKKFVDKFLDSSVFLFSNIHCFTRCSRYFAGFFTLHTITLAVFYLAGFAYYIPNWGTMSTSLILKVIFGFFIAFLLAWSEELIFRGMIYNYFAQFFTPAASILFASIIFTYAHIFTNDLNFMLCVGLFLLGVILNLIFVITGKLYPGIGAHMGLVSVKVFLRRVPMLGFLPDSALPFWVNSDLRQSILIHALFLGLIIVLSLKYKDKLLTYSD